MASFNRSEVQSISNHESSFSPHPPGLMVLSPSGAEEDLREQTADLRCVWSFLSDKADKPQRKVRPRVCGGGLQKRSAGVFLLLFLTSSSCWLT